MSICPMSAFFFSSTYFVSALKFFFRLLGPGRLFSLLSFAWSFLSCFFLVDEQMERSSTAGKEVLGC
jgi:hypothetical protein